MKNIEFIYVNFISDLCPSVKNVVVHEGDIKDVNFHEGEVDVVFYEGDKLVMNVYASRDITVSEIQRFATGYKFFNINLEFIKHSTIPYTNLCLIEFEVCSNEWHCKYDW